MMELLTIALTIIERGLIFSLVVAAVFLASRLIKFDNLAIEGAFGIGGALCALLLNNQSNPWIALACASLCGALSGSITGLLTTHLKLNKLISGVVVTTGLFSIALKIGGSSSILKNKLSIFTALPSWLNSSLIILVTIVTCIFVAIHWFLKTEVGLLLHAVGDNPQMLINLGKNVHAYKITCLALSNGLAALAGALFVQYTGYFSLWSSIGVLIIGLAGMVLAQLLSQHFGIALLLGAIVYQFIISLTFELQLDQDWNKLVTALLIVGLIALNNTLKKRGERPCLH